MFNPAIAGFLSKPNQHQSLECPVECRPPPEYLVSRKLVQSDAVKAVRLRRRWNRTLRDICFFGGTSTMVWLRFYSK